MFTAEDYQEAEQARVRLIRRLNKYGGPRARRLARIMNRCTGNTPCRSGACPVCGFALQRAAVSLGDQWIEGPARALRGRMTALTIVPSAGCVAPDALTPDLYRQVATDIITAVRSLALPPMILGVEVSFNEDLTGALPPHWSVHAQGIGLDWLSRAQAAALRSRFPPSAFVRRPVVIQKLDGRREGRLYANKWQRFRRQQYLNEHPAAGRGPHKSTRSKSLRPSQGVRLARVEHHVGLAARVMTNRLSPEVTWAILSECCWPRDGPYAPPASQQQISKKGELHQARPGRGSADPRA